MKTLLLTLLGTAFLGSVLPVASLAADQTKDSAPGKSTTMTKPYRHVVLFQFKADASPEAVKNIEKEFVALKDKISAVVSLEWGKNVSPEGLNDGLTHAFFVTFANKEAIEKNYLHHPAHEEFVSKLKPLLEKAVVVDYVTE